MSTMLLMGAVILLFMWLTRPKADQQLNEEINSPTELSEAASAVNADTLSRAQIENIVNIVRQNGTADTAAHTYSLTTANANLTVGADSRLSGSVNTASNNVDIAELITPNHLR